MMRPCREPRTSGQDPTSDHPIDGPSTQQRLSPMAASLAASLGSQEDQRVDSARYHGGYDAGHGGDTTANVPAEATRSKKFVDTAR